MHRSTCVFAFGLLVAGCSGDFDTPALRVSVTVSNPTVAVGSRYRIRAVVVNHGADSASISSTDAQIPILRGMTFGDPGIVAIGIWTLKVAPGDSIVLMTATPPVASGPGDYTLQIRPFTEPAGYVSTQVHVTAQLSGASSQSDNRTR